MKIPLRSSETTEGRRMAGARSLWRANGMKESHFGKPVIAVVNSFTQFVPGHRHLHTIGQQIKSVIEKQGCFAAEFNTIAIDDGIAMGHSGMLYSLPSRELIADSVEYMCNAHKADAMICISNCDKITPGMLMASMRLNIPAIFVSGGPMEAGIFKNKKIDLVDVMVMGADNNISDDMLKEAELAACPGCGSCSGMFTANSMNCLNEALGLALPGNGTIVATHHSRMNLYERSAKRIVEMAFQFYEKGDSSVLPRSIATKNAFINAMSLDMAMGGSTNTVLHLLAIANEAGVEFTLNDIDDISRRVPCLCKVSPNSSYHIEDVNRAGGIMSILGELERSDMLDCSVKRVDSASLSETIMKYDITRDSVGEEAFRNCLSSPASAGSNFELGSQYSIYPGTDTDRINGCIRNVENAYHPDGGLAVLYGNIATDGCIVKSAGVDNAMMKFTGKAKVFDSQEAACDGILSDEVQQGDVVVIRYEGPRGGPGMQEMLYPTSYLKSKCLDKKCALITDGRFSGGSSGLSIGHISPEAAAKGNLALLENGDPIEINIPERQINVLLSKQELKLRRDSENDKCKNGFKPKNRNRIISTSLQLYAQNVSSADKGAVRILNDK